MQEDNLNGLSEIVEYMDREYGTIDGPKKVFLLRTAASYYENLTAAEAHLHIIRSAFDIMK